MCKEERSKILGHCCCLENGKSPSSQQRLLIEEYIPVFKSHLRQGPEYKTTRYISKKDLLVVLDFFWKTRKFNQTSKRI